MNDPTQINENRFWDDVADWVVDSREFDADDLSDTGIESMLRDLRDDLDSL